MNHRLARSGRFAMAAVFTLVLAACGGGGSTSAPIAGGGTSGTGVPPGGGGTGVTGAPIVSGGAMVKGSVIVNGIRFDDTAAVIGDDRTRTAAQLANGMVVRVRGRSDDNVNGVAERVEVENEIRATIQSRSTVNNTQSFVAGGVTVIVDSQTVFANVSGFDGLAPGQRVEVHGLRDANGNLRATRVEAVGAADGVDELRGAVSGLNAAASQFTLNNGITVNYSGATFSPAGTTAAALANGLVVEVRGSLSGTVFTATQVDVEDLEDSAIGAKENEKTEYEGFVSGFSAHPGTFQVNSRAVQTTTATRFVGGTSVDLANNAKVEAEGVTVGGVLVASKIEFKQTRVLLYGKVTFMNAGGGQFKVLDQAVVVNAQTKIVTVDAGSSNSAQLADLLDNECAEVKAYLDGATITASEVKEDKCDRELVQARVVAENETTFTLTFLNNLSASLGGAGTQFRNTAGQSISRAEFFAAVVPASASNVGTLVKVKGKTLSAAEEAELQN